MAIQISQFIPPFPLPLCNHKFVSYLCDYFCFENSFICMSMFFVLIFVLNAGSVLGSWFLSPAASNELSYLTNSLCFPGTEERIAMASQINQHTWSLT